MPGDWTCQCPQCGCCNALVIYIYIHDVMGSAIKQLDDINVVHHNIAQLEIRVESQQTSFSLRFSCQVYYCTRVTRSLVALVEYIFLFNTSA
jgi:hypothetical protein